MWSKSWIILFCLIAATAWSSSATALSFSRIASFEEIVATAPLAFRGEVLNVASVIPPNTRMPYTEVTFRVLEGFAGVQAGELHVHRLAGGRIPMPDGSEDVVEIPGLPHFEPGGEYIVFHNDRLHPTFGASYAANGVFRVADGVGGRREVLDQYQRPLTWRGSGMLGFSRQLQCDRFTTNQRSCESWRHEVGEVDADYDEQGRIERTRDIEVKFATLREFTARIRSIYKNQGRPQGPARTRTANRQSFEQLLGTRYPTAR